MTSRSHPLPADHGVAPFAVLSRRLSTANEGDRWVRFALLMVYQVRGGTSRDEEKHGAR